MLSKHVALVSLSKQLTPSELAQTAAALQKQATRDLGTIWNVQATIDYFPDLESVPLGYWPIIISENVDEPGAAGFHTDKDHQPFSLVELNSTWQLTCSHEMCEMLVDPYGNKLASAGSEQLNLAKVNFLVEVCDPCEDASFAYSINGILMSDFYTPNYFDPKAVSGIRYSFTGSITKPCEIKKNGYLSWQDPITKKWSQATFFGGTAPVIKELKGMTDFGVSLRSQVDNLTKNPNIEKSFKLAAKKHAPLQGKIFKSGTSKSDDVSDAISKYLTKKKSTSRNLIAGKQDIDLSNIDVVFKSGLGKLTATHFESGTGAALDEQTVDKTSTINFTNVTPGDTIAINGLCAGTADITIDRTTVPDTPAHFSTENFHRIFVIQN